MTLPHTKKKKKKRQHLKVQKVIELGIVLPVCDALAVDCGGVRKETATLNWFVHGTLCDFSAAQSAKPS